MGGTPTPILNECLEEAVARLLELTQLMADTGGVVDGIGEAAHHLDEVATSGDATGMHDAVVAVTVTAERISHELDVEEDAANAALHELGEQATETAAAIERVLSGVRQHAAHLVEVRGQVVTSLDTVLGATRDGFGELAQAVAAYQAGLEAALTRADELFEGLQTAVNDAHDRLQRRYDKWDEALGRLASGALEATRGVAAGVHESAAVLGREVVEFANAAIDHHNTAVLALRRGFTAEDAADAATSGSSGPWMDTFTMPLAEAVQEVEAAGDDLDSWSASEVVDLTQLDLAGVRAANRVADLVARVAPARP
jgi:hypothetical protein